MKCEEVRELILTDRVDGELDVVRQNELDRHLLSCASCAELDRLVGRDLRGIFAGVKKETPPAYLWSGIRERIVSGSARDGALSGALGRMRDIASGLFRIPRPVVAFAAVSVIIIAMLASIPMMRARALDNYLNEQVLFMESLDVVEANGEGVFDIDVKTGVENLL